MLELTTRNTSEKLTVFAADGCQPVVCCGTASSRLYLGLALTASILLGCTAEPVRDEPRSSPSMETALDPSDDPAELARSWQASLVRLPDGKGNVIETDIAALESGSLVPQARYPLVIYLHGCSGFWSGTLFRMNWLARNGFAVIAPSSFARAFYPESCNLETRESGLYRPTLGLRQNDADYAIEQARIFPWVDRENVFLMGLSEGAAVATTYSTDDRPSGFLKARVAESWTCHSGWDEFIGINAPENEPVLSLLADDDPWYTSEFHKGSCEEFMSVTNGSFSFVVDYPPLRHQHELMENSDVREIVLDFLLRQTLGN